MIPLSLFLSESFLDKEVENFINNAIKKYFLNCNTESLKQINDLNKEFLKEFFGEKERVELDINLTNKDLEKVKLYLNENFKNKKEKILKKNGFPNENYFFNTLKEELEKLGYTDINFEKKIAFSHKGKSYIENILKNKLSNSIYWKVYLKLKEIEGQFKKINSLFQENKKFKIIISRNLKDIASQSTGKGWTSCKDILNLKKNSNENLTDALSILEKEIFLTFIAYLVTEEDKKEIKNPLARINIIPYFITNKLNKEKEEIFFSKDYKNSSFITNEEITKIIKETIKNKKYIYFTLQNITYGIGPTNLFSKNFPEIDKKFRATLLKWLNTKQKRINTLLKQNKFLIFQVHPFVYKDFNPQVIEQGQQSKIFKEKFLKISKSFFKEIEKFKNLNLLINTLKTKKSDFISSFLEQKIKNISDKNIKIKNSKEIWESVIININFLIKEIILKDLILIKCSLKNLNFKNAIFKNSIIENCYIENSIFENGEIKNCSFFSSENKFNILKNINQISGKNFFEKCIFLNIPNLIKNNNDFLSLNSSSNINNFNFCEIKNSSSKKSIITGKFQNCVLSNINLKNCVLIENSTINNCELEKSHSIFNSKILNSNISFCTLKDSFLKNNNLIKNTSFYNCEIFSSQKKTILENCTLKDTKIKNSILKNCTWEDESFENWDSSNFWEGGFIKIPSGKEINKELLEKHKSEIEIHKFKKNYIYSKSYNPEIFFTLFLK